MLNNFIYYKNTMSERMFGMGSLRNCGSNSWVRDTQICFIGGKAKNLHLCLMRCGRVGSFDGMMPRSNR